MSMTRSAGSPPPIFPPSGSPTRPSFPFSGASPAMPDHGRVLTSLHIYPVKGCRGLDLSQSDVEPWGLAGDRRWLLVDQDGRFVSQREHAELARVVITPRPRGTEGPSKGHPPLTITSPAPDELLKVSVWSS